MRGYRLSAIGYFTLALPRFFCFYPLCYNVS